MTPHAEGIPNSNSTPAVNRGCSSSFQLEEHPLDEISSIKVIVVGGGISGILAGILLPIKVPGLQLRILERNSDLGGVWHTNVYPGVKCDIPADVYQSTFAPSTAWTSNYPSGDEIQEYWKSLAMQYDVEKLINYNTSVERAQWCEKTATWKVYGSKGEETFEDEAHILITATGLFSTPVLPDIPGLKDFEGVVMHTGGWDPSFDAKGKRLAVIGNGSSGLQILPQLQKVAHQLDHYVRSRTWVAPSFGGDGKLTEKREAPPISTAEYIQYRKRMENMTFARYSILIKNQPMSQNAKFAFQKLMAERLGSRTDLLHAIVPDFSPNCRRLTPAPGYLEALAKDNVEYITTSITNATKTGLATQNGVHRDYDAIVCCTGSDTSFAPTFSILAREGFDLQQAWRSDGSIGFPDTYLGIAAPSVPNLFFILGPNSTGHPGPLIHTIETQIAHLAKVLRKVSMQRIRTITPTAAAAADFRAVCEAYFPRTVMSESCRSWYNGGVPGGRNMAFWPGSAWHANIVRRDPRWEDYEYTYQNPSGNRFAYFGNGWTLKDVEAAANPQDPPDFTSYLDVNSVTGSADLKMYHESWCEGWTGV